MKHDVLFVDDEPAVLQSLNWLFRSDYNVHLADSAEKALTILKEKDIDVIVSDQKMPSMNGTSLLALAGQISPSTIRVLLTGYSDFSAAVQAVNVGEVFRFIRKPWDNDHIKSVVAEAAVASQISMPNKTDYIETEIEETAGVLVVNGRLGLFEHVEEGLKASYVTYRTEDVYQAMDLMEWHHIGVVIIECDSEVKKNMLFVKVLKIKHPEIISIVVCQGEDVEEIISLINLGQIHRFVKKPVNKSAFSLSIDSALKRHSNLVLNSDMKLRYSIDKEALVKLITKSELASEWGHLVEGDVEAKGKCVYNTGYDSGFSNLLTTLDDLKRININFKVNI